MRYDGLILLVAMVNVIYGVIVKSDLSVFAAGVIVILYAIRKVGVRPDGRVPPRVDQESSSDLRNLTETTVLAALYELEHVARQLSNELVGMEKSPENAGARREMAVRLDVATRHLSDARKKLTELTSRSV